MARGEAPRALRVPISRVRSETLTSMMFIRPIPARNRVMMPMMEAAAVMPPMASSKVETMLLLMDKLKEWSSPGRSRRTTRMAPTAASANSITSSGRGDLHTTR